MKIDIGGIESVLAYGDGEVFACRGREAVLRECYIVDGKVEISYRHFILRAAWVFVGEEEAGNGEDLLVKLPMPASDEEDGSAGVERVFL